MLTEILIFALTTIIAYYIYAYKRIHQLYNERGVKYSPGVPVFGNAFNSTVLRKHLIDDLTDIYKKFPDERYVGYVEGNTPVIMIRDPELIKKITVKDFDHFTDHKAFVPPELAPLLGDSLIMMKGDRWRDMRTTLTPAFTGSKMRMLMPFVVDICHNITQHLKDHTNEVIEIGEVVKRYTSDVIASTAFGVEINSVKNPNNEFYKMGQSIFEFTLWQRILMFMVTEFPTLGKKLKTPSYSSKMDKFLKKFVIDNIEYRKNNNLVRPDMIHLLMEASKGNLTSSTSEKDNVGYSVEVVQEEMKQQGNTRDWTIEELAGQVFIFLVAGFDTSSSSVNLCIHELALNPDIQEKLYEEIRDFKKNNKELTYDNIGDMKYLDCVLNETFRRWSVSIYMDRVCTREYILPPPHQGGKPYKLSQGDIVYNVINPIHMDPKYWSKPEVFNPDRFSEDNKHNIKPFTFMPFGMGPRTCIGSRFALLKLKVLLYNLILNFKIVKCPKTSDPIKLKPLNLNVAVLGGTWVKLKCRN